MKTARSEIKRILVVEDEAAISDVCRRVLTSEGFEVDIAVNGKIAQDTIEERQCALCLIDIRLQVMNGKELYQWLQEKHPQLASRVIFTTGDMMSEDTQSFFEEVARPFLPKPFTPDELKDIVIKTLKEIEN